MDPKIGKKTQDTLGKIIKKPPLTDRLLAKPPFRFLHDITTSVVKSTGFMKGLHEDSELNSENVKDKESKIAFLQKVIDIVGLVTGKQLSVRPGKIVAGQEPEKTNELLQALAQAINKQVDNDEFVKKLTNKDIVGEEKKDREKEKSERKKHREEEKEDKQKDKDTDDKKHREKSRDREKSKDRDRENSKDRDREKDREKDEEKKDKVREKRDKSKHREDREERHKDRENHDKDEKPKDREGRHRDKEERHKDREERHKERKSKRRDEEGKENESPEVNGEREERIPRPSSAKGSRRRREDDDDDQRKPSQRENDSNIREGDLPPQIANARRQARPSSARPAPPRPKQDAVESEPSMRLGTGKPSNLIVDDDKESDDDDDNFLVEDSGIPPPEPEQPQPENEEDEDHGGLVKKMLETKKELENQPSHGPQKKVDIERSAVSDAARRKQREHVQREIDKLRTSIQSLTRSANPLGKIMDYVQEDLDSMQKELEKWKSENREHALELKREKGVTDRAIEPLKVQLSEIDQAIKDQLDASATFKANIIKNDLKIQKMLKSIARS